ncbi:MAG: sugar transferase [Leptolyngbyaceae cyanobacterium bins.59]|nr:sugar transferase [Leptolyngbyaceae cyanobacterium bins.59]
MDGICTLANDYVYDQVVALLNSIEAILGPEMPICIYPYDDRMELLKAEVARRPQVQIYDHQDSIRQWDQFARDVWDTHPTARQRWSQVTTDPYHRFGTHRRYGAFDGPFDRFLYMDADTLLMGPVQPLFDRLENYDWVVYDFQHTDPGHVYDLASPKLHQVFPPERIQTEIFCSGLYGAKRGTFPIEQREAILKSLWEGEAEILYCMAPDQTLLNYMVMRLGLSVCNLGLELSADERTGCCVTSSHFQAVDHVLYDRNHRLTYIHYIGLSSKLFKQVCAGENFDFPYRDVFLHYRYLHEPDKRPQFTTKPKPYNAPPSLFTRVMKRVGLTR